jgi:hypothetical protein
MSRWEMRNAYKILVVKPDGIRTFTRHSSRWEDNIKIELEENSCARVDWTLLAKDRNQFRVLVNNYCFFKGKGFLNSWATIQATSQECLYSIELAIASPCGMVGLKDARKT